MRKGEPIPDHLQRRQALKEFVLDWLDDARFRANDENWSMVEYAFQRIRGAIEQWAKRDCRLLTTTEIGREAPASTAEKRGCRLCGWPEPDYLLLPVPLSSTPQVNVICWECVAEIQEMVATAGRLRDSIDPV